jgi:hypothetical protein
MESAVLGLILDSSVIHRRGAQGADGGRSAKGITLPFDDLAIGGSAIEQGYAVAGRLTAYPSLSPNDSLADFRAS